MCVYVSNSTKSFCVVLLSIDWYGFPMYFEKLTLLTNFSFLKSTKIMFLIITFKQIKLQSRSKSQIVGNCFAVPDLMWFLKIG